MSRANAASATGAIEDRRANVETEACKAREGAQVIGVLQDLQAAILCSVRPSTITAMITKAVAENGVVRRRRQVLVSSGIGTRI